MMTEQDHLEHRAFFDWFVKATRPVIHDFPATTYAVHPRIGLIRHSGIYHGHGVSLAYRPEDRIWHWMHVTSLSVVPPSITDRLNVWSQQADTLHRKTGFRNDFRQLAIFTAMLAWEPPTLRKP